MFYRESLERIKKTLEEKFPEAHPKEGIGTDTLPHHLLWMTERIKEFDTQSTGDATKAARWIGWMYCVCELVLNLWDNQTSRDIARNDVLRGNHLPH